MTEKQIEAKIKRIVEMRGGMYFKFVSPSAAGVPDRIIICPDGTVVFHELKTEAGELSEIQRRMIHKLKSKGTPVMVTYGFDDAAETVKRLFEMTKGSL